MEEALSLLSLCKEGSPERVREFLLANGNLDERLMVLVFRKTDGFHALHLSAERGRLDVMEVLIEHGADTLARDHWGNTPLHYCGHIETIQCLLNIGVPVDERNKHGDTALALLRRRGIEKAAIRLLEPYEQDEAIGIGGSSQSPRLNAQTTSTAQSHKNNIKSIWFDFCLDLGPEKLVVVLLLILLLSLYIAYVATDLSRTYDTRIPITDDMLHTEL